MRRLNTGTETMHWCLSYSFSIGNIFKKKKETKTIVAFGSSSRTVKTHSIVGNYLQQYISLPFRYSTVV